MDRIMLCTLVVAVPVYITIVVIILLYYSGYAYM